MRWPVLFALAVTLAGCTQSWGTASLGSRPAQPDESHLSDAEVRRLVALRDRFEAERAALEAQLARGRDDAPARHRRLLLVVGLADIDAAITARRKVLAGAPAPPIPPWLADEAAVLEHAREQVGRAQDRLRAARAAEDDDRGGEPAPAPAVEELADLEKADKPKKTSGRPPPHAQRPEQGPRGQVGQAIVANDTDDIDRTPELRQHSRRFSACRPPGSGEGPVQITIRAHLAADGSFRNARVEGGEGLSAQTIGCLVDVMHAIHVTPPEGGAVMISFPMTLR